MKIIVDAMGGDNAPNAIVNGSIDAIIEAEGFNILLLGDSEKINKIIKERNFSSDRIEIKHTSEVVLNEDIPTKAIKGKKDSSMVVGLNMVKRKEGDVFISAGNSGALLAGSLLILGRLKGIDRPALVAIIPTKKEPKCILDVGANTMCKPINYLQFGILGSIYMKEKYNIERPKVGLFNVGIEENKGNDTVKEARQLLEKSNLNFVGNIEGRQFPDGDVDVAVCDGFVGNLILKYTEGVASLFFGEMKAIFTSNIISKIAAITLKKNLKTFKRKFDYEELGGSPFLGVDGLVFKSHGSSNAKTFKNAIIKANELAQTTFMEQIREEFKNMEV